MNNTHINSLLEKFWNGNTSLEEENALKNYFLSKQIDLAHAPDSLLFNAMAAKKSLTMPARYDIDHWTALAQTIPAEAKLINFPGAGEHAETKGNIPSQDPLTIDGRIAKSNPQVVLNLRKWAVAASCAVLLGLGSFIIQQQWNEVDTSTVASAEEALAESEKAILFLAEHFGKGQRATTEIRHLETLGNTIQ